MKYYARPSSPKRFRELIVLNAQSSYFGLTEGLRALRKMERSKTANGAFLRKLYASFSTNRTGRTRGRK